MKTFAFIVAGALAASAAAQEREPRRPDVSLAFLHAPAHKTEVRGTRVERTLKTATWRGVRLDAGFDTAQHVVTPSQASALRRPSGRAVQGRALFKLSW